MIWGYDFAAIVAHLSMHGYREELRVDGNVLFLNGRATFTIREPNALGRLPETVVLDAFDAQGVPPPPPAVAFVD